MAETPEEVAEAMRAADGKFHYHDVVAALRAQYVAGQLDGLERAARIPEAAGYVGFAREIRELAEQAKGEG